jgi:DNA-binding response OmpR family regulator
MNIPKILIADDEALTLSTLRDYLNRRIEADILEAKDGEEVLSCLKDKPCDLMILDIHMPKKSGIQVLDELKQLGKGVHTIVITGWDSDLVINECMKRETEIITKPFSYDKLYERITEFLKKRDLLILRKDA